MNFQVDKTTDPIVFENRMRDMRLRIGDDEHDTSQDQHILHMTGYEFLDNWLKWNGIIGYTDLIVDVIYTAYGIDLNEDDQHMERRLCNDTETNQ